METIIARLNIKDAVDLALSEIEKNKTTIKAACEKIMQKYLVVGMRGKPVTHNTFNDAVRTKRIRLEIQKNRLQGVQSWDRR